MRLAREETDFILTILLNIYREYLIDVALKNVVRIHVFGACAIKNVLTVDSNSQV